MCLLWVLEALPLPFSNAVSYLLLGRFHRCLPSSLVAWKITHPGNIVLPRLFYKHWIANHPLVTSTFALVHT